MKLFEDEFAAYCGSRIAVGVGNGLDALRFALLALGVELGDEVVVPALTFVATIEAVEQAGATPVLADISNDSAWTPQQRRRRSPGGRAP